MYVGFSVLSVRLCLAFVLTGSQSREAIAAGVSQWSAVR
jgi:hypothetical protein